MSKPFEKSGFCEGLRIRALAMHSAMLKDPTFDSARVAEYCMDKYFKQYFLERREWIATKELPVEKPDPRNRAQCLKCLDIVESFHVHDFKQCKCGAMAVDGGDDYHKRVGDMEFIKEMP